MHSARHGPMTGGDGEGRRRSACEVAERIRQVIGMDDRDRGWKVAAPQGERRLRRVNMPLPGQASLAEHVDDRHGRIKGVRPRADRLREAPGRRSSPPPRADPHGPRPRPRSARRRGRAGLSRRAAGQTPGSSISASVRAAAVPMTGSALGCSTRAPGERPTDVVLAGSRPCSARAGSPPDAASRPGRPRDRASDRSRDSSTGRPVLAAMPAATQARSAWGP